MAGNSLALVWDLIARDGASPVFDRVSASAERAAATTEAAGTRVGGAMSTAAKVAGAAGLAFAAVSVKMAADFQSATVRLVTSAGESQKNLASVQQGLLNMAGELGYSTEELAAAMYKVESGGQHGAAGLTVLKAAAQGAKAEGADLTTVSDALTSVLQDYHLKASDSADVTSKLVAATASGKMTFEELAGSLSAILPIASANHVSLNDILGDLASMTVHGMSAQQASQNLADAVRHLAAPTQQSTKELAALGISATDVAANLGSKGLSGTLTEITSTIQRHMGPESTQILLTLNDALGKLPQSLRPFAEGLLDGTKTMSDLRKELRGLPPDQAAALQSFTSLITSTHQVGAETKSAGEVYQSYSGALRLALGDATSMNVALMLTGENSKTTATAIDNVTKATHEAGGNVKGWSEIQGTFNQQLSQFVHSIEAGSIAVGMKLLPALTSAFGYVNRDVVPAVKNLGSLVGDAGHAFQGLPEPIKDVALAFAGIKIAEMLGLWGKLTAVPTAVAGGFRTAAASMGGFGDQMAVQARLAQMEAGALAEVDRALGGLSVGANAAATSLSRAQMMMAGWDTELAATVVAEDAATASTGRLSAAMATAQVRGVSALRTGLSGLTSFLGGGWGVGILAGIGGLMALQSAERNHERQLEESKDKLTSWIQGMHEGGSKAVEAAAHLNHYKDQLADAKARLAEMKNELESAAAPTARGSQLIGQQESKVRDLQKALDGANGAYRAQLDGMSPLQIAQTRLTEAQNNLRSALKGHAADSPVVIGAEQALADAQANVASETERTNRATKTQAQLQQDAATAALAAVDASRALEFSQLQLADAIDQYNKDAGDGQHTSRQLREEQIQLADSARQVAQNAADAAAAQAKQSGATDTAYVSQAAFIKSLQDTAAQLNGPARDAVLKMIATMGDTSDQAHITAGAVEGLGITVTNLPDSHKVEINVPTDAQMKQLADLGYAVFHLPNGKVVISADTNPAESEIRDLLNYARNQSILYRATLPDLNGSASGSGRPGLATGGWVRGPGTGTSDSVPIMGSNGEFMVNAKAAAQHAGLLEAINSGGMPGYATGGWINVPPGGAYLGEAAVPVHVQDGGYKDALHRYLSSVPSFSGGAGSPAIRALGQQIAASMGFGGQFGAIDFVFSHESGWNPNAQNPTSTAYGIPQFLNSTWAAYGGKTSDPQRQIMDGIRYMVDRYGSPNGAASFWRGHHWYDGGGYLMPGVTMAYNGTGKPERIRTAEQEAALDGGPTHVTLQLDGDAVTALLDGRIVTAFSTATTRARNNRI